MIHWYDSLKKSCKNFVVILMTQKSWKKKNKNHSEDSSEESSQYSIHDSSSDLENLEEMETEYLESDIEIFSEKNNNAEMKIIKDSYVLVRFELEKRSKYFLGQVMELYGKFSCEVKFWRHKGIRKFAWPISEDVSIVDVTDIVQLFPNPILDRRGIKTFDISMLNLKYKVD